MSILKVNTIQDKGGNTLLSSDGAGTLSGGLVTNKYPFKAKLSSAQTSIPHDTFTKINLNTAVFDPSSKFDTSNYKYIPAETGYYQLNASVGFEANGTSARRIGVAIYKNGSAIGFSWHRLTDGAGNIMHETYINISVLDYSSSTSDYYELYGIQNNSGGTSGMLVTADGARTFLSGFKLIGA